MTNRLSLFCLAALLLSACAAQQPAMNTESPYYDLASLQRGEILHIATGRLLDEQETFSYLERYRVVYVGESHDSVDDHSVQLQVLSELNQRFPGQIALGMEMLRRPYQADVDAYIAGEMSEKDFLRVWVKNWGPRSFPYYREILRYAQEQKIPVLALNAGRDLKQAVSQSDLGQLQSEMAERLPEIDTEDPYYSAMMKSIFDAHMQGNGDFQSFLRVQSLWDETMADTAARYLRSPDGADKRLVIFAGGHHVRFGYGIPRRLFRRVPLPYVILDPFTVDFPEEKKDKLMDVDAPQLPMSAADIYWAVGYEDLEDQQVMLGVQIADEEGGGVRVLGVLPDSPSALAGFQEGDVIVSVDGQPVEETFDLTYQVGLHKPGETGPIEIRRGEQTLTLEVRYDVVKHGKE